MHGATTSGFAPEKIARIGLFAAESAAGTDGTKTTRADAEDTCGAAGTDGSKTTGAEDTALPGGAWFSTELA